MVVFVEHSVLDDPMLNNHTGFNVTRDKLMSFREGKDDLTDKIDFIICLGGDGTLLYASSLFQVIDWSTDSAYHVANQMISLIFVCSFDVFLFVVWLWPVDEIACAAIGASGDGVPLGKLGLSHSFRIWQFRGTSD